jgi:hypothetical protein
MPPFSDANLMNVTHHLNSPNLIHLPTYTPPVSIVNSTLCTGYRTECVNVKVRCGRIVVCCCGGDGGGGDDDNDVRVGTVTSLMARPAELPRGAATVTIDCEGGVLSCL